MRNALDLFDRCVQLDRAIPEEAHLFAMNISEPGWLADMIATAVSINLNERQQLLLMKDAAPAAAADQQTAGPGTGCAGTGRRDPQPGPE